MSSIYIADHHSEKLRGQLLHNAPLADYTTWQVGGLAKYLYLPADLMDLSFFLSVLPKDEIVVFLGWGSNVLATDEGFDGTVVVTRGCLNQITFREPDVISAEAGLSLVEVARFAAKHQLGHFEKIAAIPGTVGGALAMNAGAYGDQTWNFVQEVKTINRSGVIVTHFPHEYQIDYRSVNVPKNEWFVSAVFKLPACEEKIALDELKKMLMLRSEKHPLEFPNAGSVFRNPPGDYSARLIQESHLRGYRIGGASVSEKHVNFIVNDRGATADDICKLIQHVAAQVEHDHGVRLLREVRFLKYTGIDIDGC